MGINSVSSFSIGNQNNQMKSAISNYKTASTDLYDQVSFAASPNKTFGAKFKQFLKNLAPEPDNRTPEEIEAQLQQDIDDIIRM